MTKQEAFEAIQKDFEAFKMLLDRDNTDEYKRNLGQLRTWCRAYRTFAPDDDRKKLIDNAMTTHARLYQSGQQERRRKVFTAKYTAPAPWTDKQIARAAFIGKRTVYRDVDEVIHDIMPLVFGVDGLQW
jgi:hypothetical protein